MSAQAATIYGAVIAGVFGISGVLAGLLMERFLRTRGDISCDTGALRWRFGYRDPRGEEYGARYRRMNGLGPIHRGDVAQARDVEYRFDADFYNGRDLPTGLRAFEVVFHRPGDLPMVHSDPRHAETQGAEPLEVLNLPPRQLVNVKIVGSVPYTVRLEGCDRVELRAKFPDGTGFSHEIARLDPTIVLTG